MHKDFDAVMRLLQSVKPKFSKDGNMYCFLLGDNLHECVAGFGKTGWGAALEFYRHFFNETT